MYEVKRVTSDDTEGIKTVAGFISACWGKAAGKSEEEILEFVSHAVCKGRVPQSFVCYKDNVAVGSFQFGLTEPYTRPDLSPWLMNVFVKEEYRGQGAGRAMMESVKGFAKEIGLNKIYLFTPHEGFYEKFGWEKTDRVTFYGPDGNRTLPVYMLVLNR